MNKTVNITKMNIPTIIKADNAPVLPSSKVEARALGISATIPEKIIRKFHYQLLLMLFVHQATLKKLYPATKDIVVINLKLIPGSLTKLPAFSKPTATPYPWRKAIKTVPYLVI